MERNTDTKEGLAPALHDSAGKPVEQIIREHPFLEGMSPHQLRLLADCAMRTCFNKDEVILRQGDPANRFYLLLKGSVVLEWQMPHAGRKIIQVLTAGDVLGWSWLFPPYFCHFTARALEPTEAVFIYATPLREESESDHDLAYELLKRMSRVMETRLCAARREWLDQPNTP